MFESLRAQVLARDRNYPELIELSERFYAEKTDTASLQDLGNILLSSGLNSQAAQLFKKSYELDPKNLISLVGFANSVKDILYQEEALRVYRFLHRQLPEHSLIWRNFLLAMEYASFVTDEERFEYAKQWGDWQYARTTDKKERAQPARTVDPQIRVGYLSADLCQHTVGLFLRGLLKSHSNKIGAYAYHVGRLTDGVTNEIASFSAFRQCGHMSDEELVGQILADRLDVLIDLSGHTAGSRLHLLSRRLAPVQLSWLGYFATTGLSDLQGVVLDSWHVNHENRKYFTEPIILLKSGRLCYQPMEFSPEISEAPFQRNQFITFGSFNNTAKYNPTVLKLWAEILAQVPGSRLIMKWRTFHDPVFCSCVIKIFEEQGVYPDRLDLRGFSTHDQMLAEYADIDIALDPFPFSGGLTSCESLWMGVPVITLPQSRVVSRQTYAFLNAIGDLDQLIAKDPSHYLALARSWAGDWAQLERFRYSIRERMSKSRLMDIESFTREFEGMLENQLAQISGRA
jgi:protein O-GlcNAc transferase